MGEFESFLNTTYFENTVQNYLIGLIFLVIGLIFHGALSNGIIALISQLFRNSEYKLSRDEYKKIFKKI